MVDEKKPRADKGRIPQSFNEAAQEFGRARNEDDKKSKKTAWIIASVSIGVTTIAIFAFLVALLTRPEPEPTIIHVNDTTGAATVLRSVKDDKDQYDDVVNKYWLAAYVRAREGYDWYTISEQYDTVKLMSENDVSGDYEKKVNDPNGPLKTLKDKGKVVAKIESITFVNELAQVRFSTVKQSTNGDNADGSPVQKWIATIAFKYHAGWMTEQQRFVNPLGFKAVTYRADPEVISK